jgi:hypothetical protein
MSSDSLRAFAPGLVAFLGLALVAGCNSNPGDVPPAPKTIKAAQVKQMPLEESGDLSVRQNLAEPLPRGTLGKSATPTRPIH